MRTRERFECDLQTQQMLKDLVAASPGQTKSFFLRGLIQAAHQTKFPKPAWQTLIGQKTIPARTYTAVPLSSTTPWAPKAHPTTAVSMPPTTPAKDPDRVLAEEVAILRHAKPTEADIQRALEQIKSGYLPRIHANGSGARGAQSPHQ